MAKVDTRIQNAERLTLGSSAVSWQSRFWSARPWIRDRAEIGAVQASRSASAPQRREAALQHLKQPLFDDPLIWISVGCRPADTMELTDCLFKSLGAARVRWLGEANGNGQQKMSTHGELCLDAAKA